MFHTWSPKTGTYTGTKPGTVESVHTARGRDVPLIQTGDYAGLPAARNHSDMDAQVFNPATQRVTTPNADGTWNIVDLTQEQIDAKAAAEAEQSEKDAVANGFATLEQIRTRKTFNDAQVTASLNFMARVLIRLAKGQGYRPPPST